MLWEYIRCVRDLLLLTLSLTLEVTFLITSLFAVLPLLLTFELMLMLMTCPYITPPFMKYIPHGVFQLS